MRANVTEKSTPLVAAAGSNSNSKPPKTTIDSPGPSTFASRKKRILLPQRLFDLFLNPGPEKVRLYTRRWEQVPF
jgi:hypothetical protein